jgi:phage terminase large subunit-like protein
MIPDFILIEAKASGYTLVSDFVARGIPVKGFNPDQYGDKVQRVHRVSPWIEIGFAWVAAQPNAYKVLRKDHKMMVDSCAIFPKGESKDVVDTLSQAFIELIRQGWLGYAMEYGSKKQERFEERHQPGYVKVAPRENRGIFSNHEED